jgi:hypothetical protein
MSLTWSKEVTIMVMVKSLKVSTKIWNSVNLDKPWKLMRMNCFNNKFFNHRLVEKSGCLRSKELPINSRSTKLVMTEKSGDLTWTRQRNSTKMSKRIYLKSGTSLKDFLRTFLKL